MEVYSDSSFNSGDMKFNILGFSLIIGMFQVAYTFFDSPYYSKTFCWFSLLIITFFILYLHTKKGEYFLSKQVEAISICPIYILITLTMFILSSVIISSKTSFDSPFIMFTFLVLTFVIGLVSGSVFRKKPAAINDRINILVRKNEIEIRKIEFLCVLSLQRMPFLRAPLEKLRNALYIVAFFIGTGGAGIAMGLAELLKRTDVVSPEVGVHSVLFFTLGVPVLFTFGILVYSMVTYLREWRKLISGIDKEYGEHKIIFNTKKKSYKKIREILDSNKE